MYWIRIELLIRKVSGGSLLGIELERSAGWPMHSRSLRKHFLYQMGAIHCATTKTVRYGNLTYDLLQIDVILSDQRERRISFSDWKIPLVLKNEIIQLI
jgi:hypothetical protein